MDGGGEAGVSEVDPISKSLLLLMPVGMGATVKPRLL
jgi:hypothetical protein